MKKILIILMLSLALFGKEVQHKDIEYIIAYIPVESITFKDDTKIEYKHGEYSSVYAYINNHSLNMNWTTYPFIKPKTAGSFQVFKIFTEKAKKTNNIVLPKIKLFIDHLFKKSDLKDVTSSISSYKIYIFSAYITFDEHNNKMIKNNSFFHDVKFLKEITVDNPTSYEIIPFEYTPKNYKITLTNTHKIDEDSECVSGFIGIPKYKSITGERCGFKIKKREMISKDL